MKKKVMSIVLAVLMLFGYSNSYIIFADNIPQLPYNIPKIPDAVNQMENTGDVIDYFKEYFNHVDGVVGQGIEELDAIFEDTAGLGPEFMKAMDFFRKEYEERKAEISVLRQRLKEACLNLDDLEFEVWDVDLDYGTFTMIALGEGADFTLEMLESLIGDDIKVKVKDDNLSLILRSGGVIVIRGKEYKVDSISLSNDNYPDGTFVETPLTPNEQAAYGEGNAFKFTTTTDYPSANKMTVVLVPVDGDGEQITAEIDFRMLWSQAQNLPLNKPEDMSDEHWAYLQAIYSMTSGIFYGDENGNFNPDDPISRAQYVTVMGRMDDVDQNIYSEPQYADVAAGQYYTAYTSWVKAYDLYHLDDPNLFEPDKEVNREEMAYMLYNYINYRGIELADVNFEGFTDENMISDWARDKVLFLAKKGILRGHDGKFNPKATFTRAQIAQVLYNLRDYF